MEWRYDGWPSRKTMPEKKVWLLVALAVLSAGTLFVANLSAVKIWGLPLGDALIPVDGGIVIFPVSYIVSDITVQIYRKKAADKVALISAAFCLSAVVVLWIVGLLPGYPDWPYADAYAAIFGFTPRIIIGSLLGYVLGTFVNNRIFEAVRAKFGDTNKTYGLRALFSSWGGKIFDVGVFEVVAFLGILPFEEFLTQAVFAYFAGVALELILFPISQLIIVRLRRTIQ